MPTKSNESGGEFRLEIPLDASSVDGFQPEVPVKVAVVVGDKVVASTSVELDGQGKGNALVGLPGSPTSAKVVVGPGDATDEELLGLQTISRSVSARVLRQAKGRLVLSPIVISSYYWWWWLRWCRTFVIRGRVVCPDGSPVPGATVCAYDVDWWWWWSSTQQIGCATTDANGSFILRFRWCCGWWPWWWWGLRHWMLEPKLVQRIAPLLEQLPRQHPPIPSPRPDLTVFEGILAEDGVARIAASSQVDPAELAQLRGSLLDNLPPAPELEALRVWPWWPWEPWWDCAPDVIFKVRQPCRGEERLIVDESVFDVRWNVPTELDVTLTAQEACCIKEPPPPEGNCIVISDVCGSLVDAIGGNPGATASPVGYLNPGLVATAGDRPFAGAANISGLFGSAAVVDYYEFEWATASAGPWNDMPPAAAGGFGRVFWGPPLPGPGPAAFQSVPFPFATVGGRLVIESREHFEATNDPGSLGLTRFWVANRDLLMSWLTANNFADGTYYLRLVGYELVAPNTLGPAQILPLCDTEDDNGLVLTIDNATSSFEPKADIVDVRINGVSAGPCSNVDAKSGGTLQVDFVAYDVDSHLAYYSLIATYGKNLAVDLLGVSGATLTPVMLGTIPAADFVGPDYGVALGQGALSPSWRAGGLRLTIPDLREAFPETCCYQLELRVYKRTIVSCDYDFEPSDLSYYSLTVVV
jgi:hypothetical protein